MKKSNVIGSNRLLCLGLLLSFGIVGSCLRAHAEVPAKIKVEAKAETKSDAAELALAELQYECAINMAPVLQFDPVMCELPENRERILKQRKKIIEAAIEVLSEGETAAAK